MENASKALIIAGAILLSILIISLGIMVYNQAKSTVGEANLSSEATQTFNAKFISYTGSGISGTNVNALMQAIIANNATDKAHQIEVVTGTTAPTVNTDYTGTFGLNAIYSETVSFKVEPVYCPATVPEGKTTAPGYIYQIKVGK